MAARLEINHGSYADEDEQGAADSQHYHALPGQLEKAQEFTYTHACLALLFFLRLGFLLSKHR